jgi:hypothetical protein
MAKTLAQVLKAKEERLAKGQGKTASKSHGVTAGRDPGKSSDKAQGSQGEDGSKQRLLSIYGQGPKPKPHPKPKPRAKPRAKTSSVKKTLLKKPAAQISVGKEKQGSNMKDGELVDSEDEPQIFAVCPSKKKVISTVILVFHHGCYHLQHEGCRFL